MRNLIRFLCSCNQFLCGSDSINFNLSSCGWQHWMILSAKNDAHSVYSIIFDEQSVSKHIKVVAHLVCVEFASCYRAGTIANTVN